MWWCIISWLFTIGIINLVLFIIGFFIFIPRKHWNTLLKIYPQDWIIFRYLIVIFGVVVLHLIEVNVVDPLMHTVISWDFASVIEGIEDSLVVGMVDFWQPTVVGFFVLMYIAVYPFLLWFSVLYFIWCRELNSLRTLALGLVFVYLVALPFYVFVPISNVYTYFDVGSALETVIPSVEQFFYSTTTSNNCFPSLHTAMSLLVAVAVWRTDNRRFGWFAWGVAGLVIISVIYLAIHWIVDVVAGVFLVIGVNFILQRWFGDGDSGDFWFRRNRKTRVRTGGSPPIR